MCIMPDFYFAITSESTASPDFLKNNGVEYKPATSVMSARGAASHIQSLRNAERGFNITLSALKQ